MSRVISAGCRKHRAITSIALEPKTVDVWFECVAATFSCCLRRQHKCLQLVPETKRTRMSHGIRWMEKEVTFNFWSSDAIRSRDVDGDVEAADHLPWLRMQYWNKWLTTGTYPTYGNSFSDKGGKIFHVRMSLNFQLTNEKHLKAPKDTTNAEGKFGEITTTYSTELNANINVSKRNISILIIFLCNCVRSFFSTWLLFCVFHVDSDIRKLILNWLSRSCRAVPQRSSEYCG